MTRRVFLTAAWVLPLAACGLEGQKGVRARRIGVSA